MKSFRALFIAFYACTLSVTETASAPRPRGSRSDDDPNTALVLQLVSKVNGLEAQLQATQAQVTGLQSQLDLEKQKTKQLVG